MVAWELGQGRGVGISESLVEGGDTGRMRRRSNTSHGVSNVSKMANI